MATKKKVSANSRNANLGMNYTDQILSGLPKDDKHLYSFSEILLERINLKTLHEYSLREWNEFLIDRYKFFEKAVSKDGLYVFKSNKEGNRTILEWVYYGVTHALITIESLFLEYGINILLRINPVVSVMVDKAGKVINVETPTPKHERVACLYMEFDAIDEEILKKLKKRMDIHILAVQCAAKDQAKVLDLLNDVEKLVPKSEMITREPKHEWEELFGWLKNSFYFSGYAQFTVNKKEKGDPEIKYSPDSGLGIVSKEYLKIETQKLLENLENHVWKTMENTNSFSFDTIRVISPIQRFERLMRFSVRIPKKDGYIEHNFFGLIKHSALQSRNIETPVIRLKMQDIFESEVMMPESYSYNEVIRFFDSIPKFELFRSPLKDLLWMVQNLLSINGLHKIRVFSKNRFKKKNQILILVAIPTYSFTSKNISKIREYLSSNVSHSRAEFIEVRGHSTMCRIHAYFDLPGEDDWAANTDRMEMEIEELVKPWDVKIKDRITSLYSPSVAEKYCSYYLPMMPSHYRERVTPEEAVRDIIHLEKLAHSDLIQFDLEEFSYFGSVMANKVSLIFIYSHKKIDLIKIMPMLKNAGLYVYDQITTRIGEGERTAGYIQSFRVSNQDGSKIDQETYKVLLGDLLVNLFQKRTSDDVLNSLILFAKLNWRAVNVIELYRNYLIQIRAPFSKPKLNSCLLKYHGHAKMLFEYFDAKFNPDSSYGDLQYRIRKILPEIKTRYIEGLSQVKEVADDTILRKLINLVDVTLRTNFYIPKSNGETFISVKIDSSKVEGLPVPVPYREIFVHDVEVEGIHLRFGPVARGGLRWSDRPDDFRTEVLGLVKTQQTKNVVIVPVGSKGGFIIKKELLIREEAAKESNLQYRKFISGLLDITDNMDANRQASHPSYLIPYDGLDPYLVVAADKGTATFSDTANEISIKYKFWLGDGFASGGSNGYDHKKEAITARGAWECVKLHFKELGKDIQSEPTTVAGIGDMSGDVFGNGMLLSKSLKLQAAFNHIHIFLDPNPNSEESWKERKRLFDLPRSAWTDYNQKLISKGGGVFDRGAKAINLSPEIKSMINAEKDTLTGEEVIQHILKMPIELFWFGGIGTYIKGADQSNLDVGDRANDAVRIDVEMCNATVIGEGANLGITQLGRIDLSKNGKRLNCDAIDNSAGVNMSDYEVNIKIMLQMLLSSGKISSMDLRNKILVEATKEVSELVLVNNRGQHRLLSMDSIRSKKMFKVFKNLINHLKQKGLNTKSEFIPEGKELELIEHSTLPMPRPVLAVLQAYVKMQVFEYFQKAKLLNDPYFNDWFISYFPKSIINKFREELFLHPLKKEIIATVLTNHIVNRAGSCFFYRMESQTGKSMENVTKAYLIIDEAVKGRALINKIFEAENVKEEDKYEAIIKFEEVLQQVIHHMLKLSKKPDFEMINKYSTLLGDVESVFSSNNGEFSLAIKYWSEKGFDADLSKSLSILGLLKGAPDVIYLHEEEGLSVPTALRLSKIINESFHFDWLSKKLNGIEPSSDWELSLQDILTQNLEIYKFALLRLLVDVHGEEVLKSISVEQIVESIRQHHEIPLNNYFSTIESLNTDPVINLTTLSVSINRLNFLGEIKSSSKVESGPTNS